MKSKNLRLFFVSLFSVASIFCLFSQTTTLSKKAQISLLTNSSSDLAVYTYFGHTAIRICDVDNELDIVYNYGLFDFDTPNFIYRFAKGRTDYTVGKESFDRYLFSYQYFGVGITEQILNLEGHERQKIFEALEKNCLPENKMYRYNYFYDNCSTRPRNIIEQNIDGTIEYKPFSNNREGTYRELVHQSVNAAPWLKFGIDLVIGSEADKTITLRQKQFLPSYLSESFDNAYIIANDGSKRMLVSSQQTLSQATKNLQTEHPFNTPLITGLILLLICLFITFKSYKKGHFKIVKIFDILLFLSTGGAGCIIFFLMFFSEHPCVNPNWNIIWLNPVELIFALLFLIKYKSKAVYFYHFINFTLLLLFLIVFSLAWLLMKPQYMEVAFYPFLFMLIIRSGANILQRREANSL